MITKFIILSASYFALQLAIGQFFVVKKNHSNFVLITLLLSCGIWLGHAGLKLVGFEYSSPHIYFIYVPFFCLSGPMWYLYLKCLYEKYQLRPHDAVLILPSITCFLLAVPFYLQSAEYKLNFNESDLYDFITVSMYLSDRLAELVVIISLIFCLVFLTNQASQSKDTSIDKSIQLVTALTIVLLIAAFIRLYGVVIGSQTYKFVVPCILVFVGLTTIYCFSYRYPILLDLRLSNISIQTPAVDYTKDLDEYKNQIRERRWYLDPELKMKELAKRLGISPHHLSEVVNASTGKNYNNFINDFRIEHAKNILINNPQRSILDVAYASGFNSKSAFYRHFTQATSITPSEFRKTPNT